MMQGRRTMYENLKNNGHLADYLIKISKKVVQEKQLLLKNLIDDDSDDCFDNIHEICLKIELYVLDKYIYS